MKSQLITASTQVSEDTSHYNGAKRNMKPWLTIRLAQYKTDLADYETKKACMIRIMEYNKKNASASTSDTEYAKKLAI